MTTRYEFVLNQKGKGPFDSIYASREAKDAKNRELREEAEMPMRARASRVADEFMSGITFEEEEPKVKKKVKNPCVKPDFSDCNSTQLKAKLRGKKLKVSGRKAELLERLRGSPSPSSSPSPSPSSSPSLTKKEATEELLDLWDDVRIRSEVEVADATGLPMDIANIITGKASKRDISHSIGDVLARGRWLDRIEGELEPRRDPSDLNKDYRWMAYIQARPSGYEDYEDWYDNPKRYITSKARMVEKKYAKMYLAGLKKYLKIQDKAFKDIGLTSKEQKKAFLRWNSEDWNMGNAKSDLRYLHALDDEWEYQTGLTGEMDEDGELMKLIPAENYKQSIKENKALVQRLLAEYKKKVKEIVKRTKKN